MTKTKYRDIIFASVSALFVFVLLYITLGFSYCGISAPYEYDGDDVTQWYLLVKTIGEKGWFWTNDRLGAPFTLELYDFSGFFLMNFELLISKILYTFIGNPITTMNVQFLLTCSLCSFVSYFVFRALKIRDYLSLIGSILYGTTPFIMFCGLFHFSLTVAYFVPLSILLCLWCYESDNDFLVFNKNFFKNPKNILAVLFAVLISESGWGYYPIFTCFFLLVTAIIVLIESRSFKKVLCGIKLIVIHAVIFVINLIPVFAYQIKNGSNLSIAQREIADGEVYGLKIAQFFIPSGNTHGIKFIKKFADLYNSNMPLVNENSAAYLGIIGIIGFLISLYLLINRRNDSYTERSIGKLFSRLIIAAIVFASVGGFAGLLSVVFHFLRAYNRISIFILFMCLAIVLDLCEYLLGQFNGKAHKICLLVIILILAFGIYEQIPDRKVNIEKISVNSISYNSDKKFINYIESVLLDGDMVYQLPYHQFPEAGPVNSMNDYQLFAGFIHSDTLKWSYGSLKGRGADRYNRYLSDLDAQSFVDSLCQLGFTGIYIDTRAYDSNELDSLLTELTDVTGTSYLRSDDGNLIFFNLNNYIPGIGSIDGYYYPTGINCDYPPCIFDEALYLKNDNSSGVAYIVSGLSVIENNSSWVDGNELKIAFYADPETEKITCLFDVLMTFGGDQRYSVIVNDSIVDEGIISGKGQICFEIDNSDDGFNDIIIELPDAVSPYELGQSMDTRNLSISISSLEFES